MKEEFEKSGKSKFTIRLTQDDTQQPISLKVASIELFKPTPSNKTVILYCPDKENEKYEAIVASENPEAVLELVGGKPHSELLADWKLDISMERKRDLFLQLDELEREFTERIKPDGFYNKADLMEEGAKSYVQKKYPDLITYALEKARLENLIFHRSGTSEEERKCLEDRIKKYQESYGLVFKKQPDGVYINQQEPALNKA